MPRSPPRVLLDVRALQYDAVDGGLVCARSRAVFAVYCLLPGYLPGCLPRIPGSAALSSIVTSPRQIAKFAAWAMLYNTKKYD